MTRPRELRRWGGRLKLRQAHGLRSRIRVLGEAVLLGALALIVIGAAWGTSSTSGASSPAGSTHFSADCIPCPNGQCYNPVTGCGGGGGGGTCSHTPDTISSLSASVQSSNSNAYNSVTITFSEAAAATNYLEWGLSTSYSDYESGETSSPATSFTLTYLNPGTTFYYRVSNLPNNGCSYAGASSSSTFTTPEISSSGTSMVNFVVMGYVFGENRQPLPGGAQVTASYGLGPGCATGGAPTVTSTAGSNGAYSLPATSGKGGVTCLMTDWWASANTYNGVSYWTEVWYDPSEPNSLYGWDWQVFFLSAQAETSGISTNSDGGANGVYSVLAFNHSTNSACTVETGYSVSNSVYAYVGGTGSTLTNGFTATNTFPGTGSPSDAGESVGIMQGYVFDGTYTLNGDGSISLSSYNPSLSGTTGEVSDLFYTGSDPVTAPPAPSGQNPQIISIPAGNTANQGFEADGSLTIQFGVDISIGVSVGVVESVSVSTDISFGITGSQTTTNGVQCVIGSTASTSAQFFELYAQGGSSDYQGVEYHIWECAAAAGGVQPSTCSPIDEP
jgi:hypothetical protein